MRASGWAICTAPTITRSSGGLNTARNHVRPSISTGALWSARAAFAAAIPNGDVSPAGSTSRSSPFARSVARTIARPARFASFNCLRISGRIASRDGFDVDFDAPAARQSDVPSLLIADPELQTRRLAVFHRAHRIFDHRAFNASA